ncbi:hypothetical protein KUTeg_022101 [Tegillarca granosa]|uniref:Major facilitator superfamily (MFS) profile domain-containing protein n=1 Tax=Tegillarca granosa TaxID=220873 RepID=A0ABQ9EAJ9_TEGGR|nr:hypothetical protein KUTeg_022101 [Tegillarca granosa]
MTEEHKGTKGFVWILSFFAAIGGFLFGYDTGVVSGAMLLVTDRFNLTSLMQEVVVSATIAFAILFALIGGVLNEYLGRKITIIIAGFVFTAGAIVLGVAQNVIMLVIGRSILGMGIGLASMTVPVYIAECAPVELRGRLVTLNNLSITCGQFIASVVDGAFSYVDDGWRYMFGLAAVPAIIQFFGMFFLPESPRWLMKKGKEDLTREVLIKIRGTTDVGEEMKGIQELCVEEHDTDNKEFVLLKVLRTPAVRRAVIVGCGLQLFQQLSGINTVMYYSATIIRMSGFRDPSTAIWLSAMTAGVNFVFTFVGVWLVERIGRKKLILGSLFGVFLSLIVLAVGFQLAAFNSPELTIDEGSFSCSGYTYCEGCIEDKTCGFCYEEIGFGSSANGSCLKTTEKEHSQSTGGRCNSTI